MAYHESLVDRAALARGRLKRLRAQLAQQDCAGILLYDPVNIRYAADCPNMQVWTLHNRVRYLLVLNGGPVILFELAGCEHLAIDHAPIDEVRTAKNASYIMSGHGVAEDSAEWASEIADTIVEHGGKSRRLLFDIAEPHMIAALQKHQLQVDSGADTMERARLIKDDLEIAAMREAIVATEIGMGRMRNALKPGISENALFAILHATNIELGGEWIETRLLTSGKKTKPWFQECGTKIIEAGELVTFDTDMIGANGYCADLSRSWLCGDGDATDMQRETYRIAYEQLQHNIAILQPGTSLRDLALRAYRLPASCSDTNYGTMAHGIGLRDEAPMIRHRWDLRPGERDDQLLLPGMVVCVESLVALNDGHESVKLEEQVHITEKGPVVLSSFPFEPRLLA